MTAIYFHIRGDAAAMDGAPTVRALDAHDAKTILTALLREDEILICRTSAGATVFVLPAREASGH